MTTYTVFQANDSSIFTSGLSLADAANTVLTDDGFEWEIRPDADGEGFRLWASNASRNSTAYKGLRQSTTWSLASDRETAETEIFGKVIATGPGRSNGMEVVTDERFAAMLAEIDDEDVDC